MTAQVASDGVLGAPGSRRALAGFFISGLLFAFFGAILPSWGHHLKADYPTIGAYFLSVSAGLMISIRLGHALLCSKGTRAGLATGCTFAAGALLYLAAVSPPGPAWARMIGLGFLGFACGLLHSAIFEGISPIYQHDPAATTNLGGALFGAGSLAMPLLISQTFYRSTPRTILILLALIPAAFAVMYARIPYGPASAALRRPVRAALSDLRSPTAMLVGALLFFQFGNEWSVAGWLPMFLVQRLGMCPTHALLMLSVYWLVLLVGRIAVQSMLPHFRSHLLMAASIALAMFGCLILGMTDNPFGAVTGIVFTGAGFAGIYPLAMRNLENRFPNYHPAFYNGIFSVPLAGAFLAPGMLGFLAPDAGIQIVMFLPLLGSVVVALLVLAIWVEARLDRQGIRSTASPSGPA